MDIDDVQNGDVRFNDDLDLERFDGVKWVAYREAPSEDSEFDFREDEDDPRRGSA